MAKMDWPDDAGVLYLYIGHKHANHLAVSLMSLRDVYDGQVAILTDEATGEFLERYVTTDERLQPIDVVYFPYQQLGRGSAYNAKTSMGDLSPFQRTVFLDADTLVVGDFSDMIPAANSEEVRFTQFAIWNTHQKTMVGRLNQWKHVLPHQVWLQLKDPIPAINTGVLGFSKLSKPFMDRWHVETAKNIGFICDEIAAQLLYPEYPHLLLDERWNCSPMHSAKRMGPHMGNTDERILHGHGKKFLKVKKPVRTTWWLPSYKRAIDLNIASIRSWTNNKKTYTNLIRPHDYIPPDEWSWVSAAL